MRIRRTFPLLVLAWVSGCDDASTAPTPTPGSPCEALAETGTLPLFDAHFHWISPAGDAYSAADLLTKMDEGGVCRALSSSTPNERTVELMGLAPGRLVPSFRLYRNQDDRYAWSERADIRDFIDEGLPTADFIALGEFHLFAEARMDSPGVQAVTEVAAERGLDLVAHVEPSHIDYFFEAIPGVRIIWDHAGYQTPPQLDPYLARYPLLCVDLAGRDGDVAPGGNLDPAWADLIEQYPDKFMIGSDPYTVENAMNYVWILETARHWVAQLPPDVAARVAYQNGERLFSLTE